MKITLRSRIAGVAIAALAVPTVALAQDAAQTEGGAEQAQAAPAQVDVDPATVVATVGGEDITVGHMIVARTSLPAQYQQLPDDVLWEGILDQLIQQTALAQSLEKPTQATLLTIDNQRTGLLAGEALGKASAAAVTDEALQAAYDARYADAEPEQEYNASHILVETEEEAQAVLDELEGGADFAELAKAKSTGPSGPNGGQLGWFTKGMMVPEFEQAVIALDAGETAGPVQTQFGWHVVKLNETRMKDAPPLAEVRNELAQEIEQKAVEDTIAAVMESAEVSRAEVEIDPAVLKNIGVLVE